MYLYIICSFFHPERIIFQHVAFFMINEGPEPSAETDTLLDPVVFQEGSNEAAAGHSHGKCISTVSAPLMTSQRADFQSVFEARTSQPAEQTKRIRNERMIFFLLLLLPFQPSWLSGNRLLLEKACKVWIGRDLYTWKNANKRSATQRFVSLFT